MIILLILLLLSLPFSRISLSVIRPLLFGTGRSPHAQWVGGVVVEVVVEVVAQITLVYSTFYIPGEDCLMPRRRLFDDRTSVCKFGCPCGNIWKN